MGDLATFDSVILDFFAFSFPEGKIPVLFPLNLQSSPVLLTWRLCANISAQPQLLDRENNGKNNTLPLGKHIYYRAVRKLYRLCLTSRKWNFMA